MGFGDRLAGGGTKAAFPASSQKTSDQKWAEAFGDFDAKKYNEDEDAKQAERERLREAEETKEV